MIDYVQLVDISHWQGVNIDFGKMGKKAAGVFIKASQGTSTDRAFRINWENSKNLLLRGAYHYLDWGLPAKIQAEYFGNLIMRSGHGELPCVLDFECRAKVPGSGRAAIACLEFLETLEKVTGRVPMIYTSPSYWREFGTPSAKWGKYPLWIANYQVVKPTPILPWGNDWKVWQYSDRGQGINYGLPGGGIDLDKFNGNMVEFLLWAKQMTGILPSQPPLPSDKICPTCGQPLPAATS